MKIERIRVFPTRVGVNRFRPGARRLQHRFPHTRGGEPAGREALGETHLFSPHAWG